MTTTQALHPITFPFEPPPARRTSQWVAECFWPGVEDTDVLDLDTRLRDRAAELVGRVEAPSYLGSLRMTDDEVVLFLFEGPIGSVRRLVEHAGVRAERILQCTRTPVA